jgi:alpha-beta hydrolase superfamily lysophospholipase
MVPAASSLCIAAFQKLCLTIQSMSFFTTALSLFQVRSAMPRPPGRHAGVILLQGSGGESRWGTNRFIADQFARSGIAALVYDKRGSGDSTGDWKASSYDDLANDVLAGIDLLASRPDIDPSRIGLHGHSKVELSRRLLRFMLPLRSLL